MKHEMRLSDDEPTITSIVMIATGEYSDYATAPFRVLKPFTFTEAFERFKAEVQQEEPEKTSFYPDAFVGWLARNTYIEDYPCHEINVGYYSTTDIDPTIGAIEFKPADAPVAWMTPEDLLAFQESGTTEVATVLSVASPIHTAALYADQAPEGAL